MFRRSAVLILTPLLTVNFRGTVASADDVCLVRKVTYNGWHCVELTNGRIDVVVAPQLGGRIIQLRLGQIEFLWVNPDLAGKVMPDGVIPPDGNQKGPPAWANYGGDKLWPAPQGVSRPDEWPGPPDPFEKGGMVDHAPYEAKVLNTGPDEAAIELTSPVDKYAGIRFIRQIRIRPRTTTIELTVKMVNATDRTVRWGIWQVTQHGGHTRQKGSPIRWDRDKIDVQAWSEVNPNSRFPRGYNVMFGPKDSPQFKADESLRSIDGDKLFQFDYQYQVGKAGVDNADGWLAVTHQKREVLYAHTFAALPDQEHPDGASVEFWASGPGKIRLGDKDVELGDDQPVLIESEVLSPLATLEPSKAYSFSSQIHLAHGRGPVLAVMKDMAILDTIRCEADGVPAGRVAVFRDGRLEISNFLDGKYESLGNVLAGQVVDVNILARRAAVRLAPLQETPTGGPVLRISERPVSKAAPKTEKTAPAKPQYIKSTADFEAKVLKTDRPVLVDFYADWCGPCRMLAPVIEEVAGEVAGKAYVYKVNIDEHQALAGRYGIRGIPTVIVFSSGKPAETLVGVRDKQAYLTAVGKLIKAR
jgi:thioredoxin